MNIKAGDKQLYTLYRAVDAARQAVTRYEALVQRGNTPLAEAQAELAAGRVAFATRLCNRFGPSTGKE